MKRVAAGNWQFEKFQYDGMGRLTASFKCFDATEADTDYTEAASISDDYVQESVHQT